MLGRDDPPDDREALGPRRVRDGKLGAICAHVDEAAAERAAQLGPPGRPPAWTEGLEPRARSDLLRHRGRQEVGTEATSERKRDNSLELVIDVRGEELAGRHVDGVPHRHAAVRGADLGHSNTRCAAMIRAKAALAWSRSASVVCSVTLQRVAVGARVGSAG